jgi:hypothetical protein
LSYYIYNRDRNNNVTHTTMTVYELIELAQQLEHQVEAGIIDGDNDVRMATQPSWPFEYSIGQPVIVDGVVYLPQEQQLGYLPGDVKEELNW